MDMVLTLFENKKKKKKGAWAPSPSYTIKKNIKKKKSYSY
jgi:hypothetical protein